LFLWQIQQKNSALIGAAFHSPSHKLKRQLKCERRGEEQDQKKHFSVSFFFWNFSKRKEKVRTSTPEQETLAIEQT
jgi:hypothetical protein